MQGSNSVLLFLFLLYFFVVAAVTAIVVVATVVAVGASLAAAVVGTAAADHANFALIHTIVGYMLSKEIGIISESHRCFVFVMKKSHLNLLPYEQCSLHR